MPANGRRDLNRRLKLKSAKTSVQSTTGSRGVHINGSNAGYTMFRGSVKSTGYPLHSPVSPSLSSPVPHRVPLHFNWILHRGDTHYLLPSLILRALLKVNSASRQVVDGCWCNAEGQWIYGNPAETECLTRTETKPVPSAYRRALPQLSAARLVETLSHISIRNSGIFARHVAPASN